MNVYDRISSGQVAFFEGNPKFQRVRSLPIIEIDILRGETGPGRRLMSFKRTQNGHVLLQTFNICTINIGTNRDNYKPLSDGPFAVCLKQFPHMQTELSSFRIFSVCSKRMINGRQNTRHCPSARGAKRLNFQNEFDGIYTATVTH